MKSLALNETYTNSATVTLDSDTTVPYYVFVVTDSANNQAEISEDNNRSAASQVTIKTSPLSNLVAADLKVPSSASPSSGIDISWQVKNDGLWNISGTWVDSVYLRDKDNKDTLIGAFPRTERVNANSDYWRTENVKIPTVALGSYSIVVKTNSNTGVNETNTADDIVVRKITIAKPKMMTATPDMISLELTPGVPLTGQIPITIGNLGTADISGIVSVIKDASANITIQFNIPAVVGSGNSQVVNYTVTATDETVLKNKPTVTFKSSNNDEAAVTFDITVIPRRPSLVVNPGSLETGILRGQQRIVRCEITNNGGAPANNLTVLMPDVSWIKLVSPQNIGTLAVGAKAGIEVSLNPPADISLQNPIYGGSIVVSDGANVNLIIGFSITVTSDAKGGLKITAKDEESYFNKATQPNVKGATVIVTDMSGNKVAEGVTDAAGVFLAPSINEGRYNLEVRADKHASFYSSVEIAPVVVKEVEAFMQMQLVTYRWSVVPVQIEDKYKVTIEAVFETHLPAPVVTVDPAFMLVPLDEGETTTVDLKITNHGLIAANDVTINFPDNDEVYIKPLIEKIGVIDAMTTIVVPVKVRAKEDGPIDAPSTALRSSDNAREKRSDSDSSLAKCLPKATLQYSYLCGGTQVNTVYIDWSYLKKARAIIKKALAARDKAIEASEVMQRLVNIIEDLEDGSISQETVDSIAALFGVKFIIDPIKNEWVLDNSGDVSEFSGGNMQLTHYMITDDSLNVMKSKGIPDDILLKLKKLKNIEYTGKYYFLNALESAIGKAQTEQYKLLILESSKIVSNVMLRGKREDWKSYIVNLDSAVKLFGMLPGLGEKAAQPRNWLCSYSPTTCQNVSAFIERNKGNLELLKDGLSTAADLINIGVDISLCATIVVGNPLSLLSCASLVCDTISLTEDLNKLITGLNKKCISEIPLFVFYPMPIPILSVPLPECVPIQIPNVAPIEKMPCFCGFVSLASFVKEPSFSSSVALPGGLDDLAKCMCGNGGGNYTPPPGGGGGGGVGTFNPSFYNDNRAFTTKKPCWE